MRVNRRHQAAETGTLIRRSLLAAGAGRYLRETRANNQVDLFWASAPDFRGGDLPAGMNERVRIVLPPERMRFIDA